MKAPVIVAIDGPSGAGKSTVAKMVARSLGVPYIDTGAMYRAVGLAAREAGIGLPITEPEAVTRLAESLSIEIETGPEMRVVLDGRDVTEGIRAPEISRYASAVSAIPDVRRRLVAEQRRLAGKRGGVMEGRDIGTKVFPGTAHKFFLTASLPVRAERRAAELASRGRRQPYAEVLAEMEKRDRDDRTRSESPLTCDESYVVVDSTGRDAAAVAGEIERRVRGAG